MKSLISVIPWNTLFFSDVTDVTDITYSTDVIDLTNDKLFISSAKTYLS